MSTRFEVLTLCVNRGGYRLGRRVAQTITEWELAVRDAGREITAEEFGSYWRDSAATAYRRLAEFRELFPELGEHGKPSDLMDPLLKRLTARQPVADDLAYTYPSGEPVR